MHNNRLVNRFKRAAETIPAFALLVVCVVLLGCSDEYIERSDARLRELRKTEIPPNRLKVRTDEYWWFGRWYPLPSTGRDPYRYSYPGYFIERGSFNRSAPPAYFRSN